MGGPREYDPAAEQDAYCEDCGNEAGQCECDPLAMFVEDVTNVLGQLDSLAEIWGDEGVFRRCRDSLRASVKKAERWIK